MIKKKISIINLGKKNLVSDFSVKKSKLFMFALLKFYRLLVIMRLFNIRNDFNVNRTIINPFLKYKSDLRFFNFKGLIRRLELFIKYGLNKNRFLKKKLRGLIYIVKLKKKLIYKKKRIYVFNKLSKNKFQRRRFLDPFIEVKKAEYERRKKLGVIGRRLIKQKPLKNEIKVLKPLLLKLFQYINQRKGFVFKKKKIN
jgi:hypothetical protein